MSTLFEKTVQRPLADLMRPQTLQEVVGQDHLIGPDAPIARMIETGRVSSFILWGPPGCGKTTISRLMAHIANLYFEPISAVFSGVPELRKIFAAAKERLKGGQRTVLFVDEIHRFNKAQQDSFLPFVEDGTVILIGATTENPSFELNSALLSRCKVFVLKRLDEAALQKLYDKAQSLLSRPLPLSKEAVQHLMTLADGDGRYFVNLLEAIDHFVDSDKELSVDEVAKIVQKRLPIYDKAGDGHYNLISAVHKSLRGSDPQAALYWVARMMQAGEDPQYILRRLTRFAVEDVGMADPLALRLAIACWDTYNRLGSPEGDLAIAHLAVYLATAPKSISVYKAWSQALAAAKETGSLTPPKTILNAPTSLMKDMGYGADYQYDPETEDGFSGQNYFPDGMSRTLFYRPIERGFEREIVKRLAYWDELRKKKCQKKSSS